MTDADEVFGEPLASYVATVRDTSDTEDVDVLVFGIDLEDARENARREYGDRLLNVRPNIDPDLM